MSAKPTLSKNNNRGEAIVLTLAQPLEIKKLSPASQLELKYLPDRDFVTAEDLSTWLNTLSENDYENWESAASTIANIFYDTALPSHMELNITLDKGTKQTAQKVHLVKHQPKFKLTEELKKLF